MAHGSIGVPEHVFSDAATGAQLWGHPLSDYGLAANTHSRISPAVVNGVVYIGTQEGAWLLAIDGASGNLIWKTQLESPAHNAFALVTASPTVIGGVVYTGVASLEEAEAANPAYPCCQARGSVVAVKASTGAILWQSYTVPQGYSGGGVWGSNMVVDPVRKSVFASTGNNYSAPTDQAYLACRSGGGLQFAGEPRRRHPCARHEYRRDQVGDESGELEPTICEQRH